MINFNTAKEEVKSHTLPCQTQLYKGTDSLRVSVVIPTLNEALILEDSLSSISALNPHEIIVVDGGSTDTTLSVAHSMATHVITSRTGRARQMNAGAKKATGDLLLFMHADSKLTQKSFKRMEKRMCLNGPVGGAFSLQIESERIPLRVISSMATWRAKYLNLVYGDQTIFVRTDIFQELG